ncbi:LexA/Signal peptidase [Guyanagaster necrorhizus]|uniref:Mitochondrial inner membrane protease subunit 2 n=1 Tax=Guyanagaster necrorhizus TaxID=856835 RepID=A0A9P7VZF7_9AGAR|nr:LexA/Signal peptidase [Guyanagaster necrorhizus MCA 3950]KAG7449408.1 LexA/Signal peptidase [Guyanagaster necrorhizus MCA 3950]
MPFISLLLRSQLRLLIYAPIPFLIARFYPITKITGRSMQPTINPDENQLWHDFALLDRVSMQARANFKRGDIVTLFSPIDPKRFMVKRVIAKEGDIVETLPPYPHPQVCVPEGHVWVEGDDPYHSDDSNTFGPIPAALIEAKVLFIVWPLSRIGSLQTPSVRHLGRLTRGSPEHRAAVAAVEREKWRESRVIPARW